VSRENKQPEFQVEFRLLIFPAQPIFNATPEVLAGREDFAGALPIFRRKEPVQLL
jgi:hypothetical protein